MEEEHFKEVIGVSLDTFGMFVEKYKSFLNTRLLLHHFSPTDEMIIGFLHLWHYPTDDLIAAIFNVDKKSIWRIRNRIIDFLFQYLHNQISLENFPTRSLCCWPIFNSLITLAIDGSEHPVVTSTNKLLDAEYYSSKKHQHSINKLVLTRLDGKIMWMSNSFSGSNDDVSIARATRCSWYDFLTPTEYIIGDSGFDPLSSDGWRILTPGSNTEFNRLLSSHRIIIENIFAKMKSWDICSKCIRMPLLKHEEDVLDYHDKVWRIVAVLVNNFC